MLNTSGLNVLTQWFGRLLLGRTLRDWISFSWIWMEILQLQNSTISITSIQIPMNITHLDVQFMFWIIYCSQVPLVLQNRSHAHRSVFISATLSCMQYMWQLPQYHVVYDETFLTVSHMIDETILPTWDKICKNSVESETSNAFNVAELWFKQLTDTSEDPVTCPFADDSGDRTLISEGAYV